LESMSLQIKWPRKLGFLDGNELVTGRSELARLTAERDILRRRAWEWCGLFVAASLLAVALAYLALGERRVTLAVALATTMVSAVCGITAPALAISAQHGTPIGEIGLYHESRSILATVAQLLGPDGSLIVGLPLLMFSIVMPLAKTIGLGLVLMAPRRAGPPVLSLAHRIGRWSMADVFVVALLLSFFATSHHRHLEATLLPGMAFFAHYAIGSLIVAARIESAFAPQSLPVAQPVTNDTTNATRS
jgi:paraquat-inducible protein A